MGRAEDKAPGLGVRLREAMRRAGYESDGKYGVAVQRFAMDHRIPVDFLYKWLDDVAVPSRANVLKVAAILGITPGWLLFGPLDAPPKGKRRPHPIAGGSGALEPYPVHRAPDVLPLIRHWLRRLSWLGTPTSTWAIA